MQFLGLLHCKLKYSFPIPFTSGSYTLKLWVGCVYLQMSVAKVENCCPQDSYLTVPPTMITHPTCLQTSKHCLPLCSVVHQTKGQANILGTAWRQVFKHRPPGPNQQTWAQLWFICNVGLVLDTRLSVTPLEGHLGCLESGRSIPVVE